MMIQIVMFQTFLFSEYFRRYANKFFPYQFFKTVFGLAHISIFFYFSVVYELFMVIVDFEISFFLDFVVHYICDLVRHFV